MKSNIFTTELGGKTLTVECTDLATFANGSVLVRYGETVVLVTAVMSKHGSSHSYFPLTVEFEEKFYAAGAILGSRFLRREGRPSEDAVLAARVIDRTIRPLFPVGLTHEVQIVITVIAIGEDDPDVPSIIGASLALGLSDIPWGGPVGAVRLLLRADSSTCIVNPTYAERTGGMLASEFLICGNEGSINMIEAVGNEVEESTVIDALTKATEIHKALETFQAHIVATHGKVKRSIVQEEMPLAVQELFTATFSKRLYDSVFSNTAGKDHLTTLEQEWTEQCATTFPDVSSVLTRHYFSTALSDVLHHGAVVEGKRADGRTLDTVRPLYAQAGGMSPVLHGSGIFYRGETHVFSALTLGGPDSAQVIETIEERSAKKRFMHHYNFPPFSVGETGRSGSYGRRTIGHGALAEKALLSVIPNLAIFPYTIRLVSETFSSNGSSSMASVCASSLALMDGGVPITRPVAGIACGVMFHQGSHAVLTDIQGPEDEYGDMDLKVAGTTLGVTAIQLDVKVGGIPVAVIAIALAKAQSARLQILDVMAASIPSPRSSISNRAPEICMLVILPEQIGLVIGGGGKTINALKSVSGVEEISIEEDGTIFITGKRGTALVAKERIKALTRQYHIGEIVTVTVTKIVPFGA